jgi:hypothetical protein
MFFGSATGVSFATGATAGDEMFRTSRAVMEILVPCNPRWDRDVRHRSNCVRSAGVVGSGTVDGGVGASASPLRGRV